MDVAHEGIFVLIFAVMAADGGVQQCQPKLLAEVDGLFAHHHPVRSGQVGMAAQG